MALVTYGQDGGFSGVIGSVVNGPQILIARIEGWSAEFEQTPLDYTGPGDGGNPFFHLGDSYVKGTAQGWTIAYGNSTQNSGGQTAFGPPLQPGQKVGGTLTLIHSTSYQFIQLPVLISVMKCGREIGRSTPGTDKWPLTFAWVGSGGPPSLLWKSLPPAGV